MRILGHIILGLFIILMAVMLIYARIDAWQKFKRKCEETGVYWTDKDIKKHQRKLIIYAIIFVIGVLELFF